MILRKKKICCKDTRNELDKLSQQNRVIKFCIDAGFLTTVEVGQYFVTEHTHEFLQFTEPVTCREYTLPRDKHHLTRKVGFERTPKLGPCWKSQTATYKVNMEWKSELNRHSWVRITRGSSKLVTELSNNKENDNNEQETSEMQFDNFALKSNARAFASRSKADAKPH